MPSIIHQLKRKINQKERKGRKRVKMRSRTAHLRKNNFG